MWHLMIGATCQHFVNFKLYSFFVNSTLNEQEKNTCQAMVYYSYATFLFMKGENYENNINTFYPQKYIEEYMWHFVKAIIFTQDG